MIKMKIEKVPRGIQGEKSNKDMASSRNLVSTIGAQESPKRGTEPGVRKGTRSLLAYLNPRLATPTHKNIIFAAKSKSYCLFSIYTQYAWKPVLYFRPTPLQTFLPEDLQHCRPSPFHCRPSPGKICNIADLPLFL